MKFEWDPAKAAANRRKHGISFESAASIWDGGHIEVDAIARSEDGEERGATLGKISGNVCVAIWTKRFWQYPVDIGQEGEKK